MFNFVARAILKAKASQQRNEVPVDGGANTALYL
jgi:hypothetical protein